MTTIESFIRAIPKAELHLHVEGTLEPELKFELVKRNGIDLPYESVGEMRTVYDFDDLPSFPTQYYEDMSVLLSEQDFYDLAMACFTRVADQNVVYTEMFFDPQVHTTRGVEFSTVIEGLHRAQGDAEENLGIRSQLIMCSLRDMSAESAADTLEQADAYRDWIVGVGLDSDERGKPPVEFADVFVDARSRGYRLTMHCDVDQENSVDHIRQCLDVIEVERIDHGVNAIGDEELCREIVRRGIGLTVCPISNDYVTDGTKADTIVALLERGVKVTINSDDPAYFPGYMEENLVRICRQADRSVPTIVQLVCNAFDMSWLEPAARSDYLAHVDTLVEVWPSL